MKKRILSLFLVVVLLLSAFPQMSPTAGAATYSGTCGDSLTWSLDTDTGVLTISGTGAMTDYSSSDSVPWYSYRDSITSAQIGEGVTSIGDEAFYDHDNLTSVTIPNSVTSIGDEAFRSCNSLTSVTIPDSVKSIGDEAFSNCSKLTSVTIPGNVTSIGEYAFMDCYWMSNVTICNGVKSIGMGAFSDCYGLTSVSIPDSVMAIGDHAFRCCEQLTGIWVDEANEHYSSDISGVLFNKEKTALLQCPGAYSGAYKIPNSVTSIGEYAFFRCDNLTSIRLFENVAEIGNQAMSDCDSLTGIWVDEANQNYSSDANGILFDKEKTELIQCPGTYSGTYTIPDSVTSIGDYAFESCSNLTSVMLPDSVTSIGDYAFGWCDNLTNVVIGNGVTIIGWFGFCGCESLKHVFFTGTEEQWNSICIEPNNFALSDVALHCEVSVDEAISEVKTCCGFAKYCTVCDLILEYRKVANSEHSFTNGFCSECGVPSYLEYFVEANATVQIINCDSSVTEAMIPDTIEGMQVASIGSYAFEWCPDLMSVTIPDSVTSIFFSAFSGCNSLTGIWVDAANQYYSSDASGVLFNKEKTELIKCPEAYSGEYTIPDSVISIGPSAFSSCDSLKRVTIPDGVTIIDSCVFSGCSNLMEVIIPDSVTSIGSYAFNNCDSLTSVTITANVTSIDTSAFSDCDSLTGFRVNEANQYYSSDASGVLFNKEKTELIQCPGAYSGEYTIPDSVINIDAGAFSGCNVMSIVIPDSMTSINDSAFYFCPSLTSVTIPDSITNIEEFAFYLCHNLNHVFYTGTEEQWNSIQIDSDNHLLTAAVRHYEVDGDKTFASETCCGVVTSCKICDMTISYQTVENAMHDFVDGICAKCDVPSYLEYEISSDAKVRVIGCDESVTEVLIPDTIEGLPVVYINIEENRVFTWIDNLTAIYVEEANHYFSSDANGVLFDKEKTELIRCPGGYSGSYAIPDSVTSIRRFAFYNCNRLTSVTIPDGVISIANYSFSNCSSLTSVIIPDSLTRIDMWTFSDCDNLKDIYYSGTEEAWNKILICAGNDELFNATIHFNYEPSEEPSEPSEETTEPSEEPSEPSEEPSEPSEEPSEPSEEPSEPSEEPSEPSEPEIPTENPFTDVKESDYFATPVLWAVGKNITNGMSATSFAPNENCTRGQIVTFLWRACGSPEPTKTDNPFTDVKADAYYYKAVLWAVENGITTGLSATTFGPNATCTRGQVATFLWRSQGEPEPTSTNNPFSDVKTSDYYFKAVLWAVENEVTQGVGGGKFAPNDSCTRGQIVTFLYRAIA